MKEILIMNQRLKMTPIFRNMFEDIYNTNVKNDYVSKKSFVVNKNFVFAWNKRYV